MGWWSVLDVKLVMEPSLGKGGSQRQYPHSRAHNRKGCTVPEGVSSLQLASLNGRVRQPLLQAPEIPGTREGLDDGSNGMPMR